MSLTPVAASVVRGSHRPLPEAELLQYRRSAAFAARRNPTDGDAHYSWPSLRFTPKDETHSDKRDSVNVASCCFAEY